MKFKRYKRMPYAELMAELDFVDAKKYPSRHRVLTDEIALRKLKKEHEHSAPVAPWDTLASKNSAEDGTEWHYFEFSENGRGRWIFLTCFIAANLVFLLSLALYAASPKLEALHRFDTYIDTAQCETVRYYENSRRRYVNAHVLELRAYDLYFYAPNISYRTCKVLPELLIDSPKVTLWHDEQYVYQLSMKEQMPITYEQMSQIYRDEKTKYYPVAYVALCMVWGYFLRSLINAVSPGSFISRRF